MFRQTKEVAKFYFGAAEPFVMSLTRAQNCMTQCDALTEQNGSNDSRKVSRSTTANRIESHTQ